MSSLTTENVQGGATATGRTGVDSKAKKVAEAKAAGTVATAPLPPPKEFELFGSDDENDQDVAGEDKGKDGTAPTVPEQDKYVSMKGLYHGMGELSLVDIPKRKELYDILVRDHPVKKGKAASTSERIETNNKASTLVYGEISFNSFAVAVEKVKNKYGGLSKPGGIFYDIGAGTGKPALAAALLHDFDEVRGIEILDGLHSLSLELKEVWRKQIVPLVPERKANTKITFLKGDATVMDWSDGTFCFANSTCFDDTLMQRLAEGADNLPTGTFFVTFTKRWPSDKWTVLEHESHPMSWGHATVYIHQKI
jgi:SAM-dependent methyltransferase